MIRRLTDAQLDMLISLVSEPRWPSREDVVAKALVRMKLARWKIGSLVVTSEGLSLLAYLGKV